MPTTTPSLRLATKDDVNFLADVVLLTNEERYAVRPGWDRDAFYRGLIEDAADQVAGGPEASTTYVIMVGREPVGRLRIVRMAAQIEIAGLQVMPEHQSRGIGSAVIAQVFTEAESSDLPVSLEVELDNPRAKQLYERHGFVQTGIVDHDRHRMVRPAR